MRAGRQQVCHMEGYADTLRLRTRVSESISGKCVGDVQGQKTTCLLQTPAACAGD